MGRAPHRRKRSVLAGLLIGVAVLALAPAVAAAQDDRKPAPEELWEAYPLQPRTGSAPVASPTAAAASTRAPTPATGTDAVATATPATRSVPGGAPTAALVGFAALLAFGGGVAIGARRRSARLGSDEPEHVEPVPAADPGLAPAVRGARLLADRASAQATAGPEWGADLLADEASAQATGPGSEPRLVPAARGTGERAAAQAAEPDGEPSFVPADRASAQATRRDRDPSPAADPRVQTVRVPARAPEPPPVPGRRFVRTDAPVAAPPAPAPRRPPPLPASAPLRAPRVPWPAGTEHVPRCEITWRAGYRTSYFEANVTEPGRRHRRPLKRSRTLRWLLNDPADTRRPELVAALRELTAELEREGWTAVARGGRWYSSRFVHTEGDR